MALAANLALVTVTGQYVDYEGNPIAGQIEFRLPKTLQNALADQIVVQSTYSATLDAFGSFSITVPATDDPNLNETFQYTITEAFLGGRTWQVSLPGIDSFEDLSLRYATFADLTGSGQTFGQLVGVADVKISSLVPVYSGESFTELAAYQAYVVEEQAVAAQEALISLSPAGVKMPTTYGSLLVTEQSFASVAAAFPSYTGLLSATNLVATSSDVTPFGTTRVNLVTNPSVETDAATWNANNATGARSTLDSYAGSASYRTVFNTTPSGGAGVFWWAAAGSGPGFLVTAGLAYTFSVWVKDTAASRGYRASLEWRNSAVAAGTLISTSTGSLTTVTLNGWTRVSITATAPAGAQSVIPSCYVQVATTSGQVVYFDAALLEQASTVGSYFDGSKDGFWTGNAHTSTSRNATAISAEIIAEAAADLAIEQAEELFPHPFVFTGSLGVQR
jgi:hypothetical protein